MSALDRSTAARVTKEGSAIETTTPAAASIAADGDVVWLPEPGDDPPLPAGAKLLRGSAYLPGAHLVDLVETMDLVRVECPWDARQTHQSLVPHLLEEPYEALDALESGELARRGTAW